MKGAVCHISCPSCGATLALLEGKRVCTCSACGTRSLVEIKDMIPKFAIEPELNLQEAKLAAIKLLAKQNLAADLKKAAKFYDAGLYYLPIYELGAQRVGKMTVREIIRKNEFLITKEKATVLLSDIQFQSPAVKLGDWGIEDIKLEKLRQIKPMKPFDSGKLEKDAHVFDSTLPPDAAGVTGARFSTSVAGDETKFLRVNLRIVFCPVWLIKYSYHNRLYRIVIDAVTGAVLFGRAPAGDVERIPAMIAALAVMTYPLSRAARFLFTGNAMDITGFIIFLAVPLFLLLTFFVIIVAMAWNQFRYSGEVVWRGERIEVERLNKPPETGMEKLAGVMLSFIASSASEIKLMKSNRWYDGI